MAARLLSVTPTSAYPGQHTFPRARPVGKQQAGLCCVGMVVLCRGVGTLLSCEVLFPMGEMLGLVLPGPAGLSLP